MREHGYRIVCLSANSDDTGSILCSRIMHFSSYTAAVLVDRLDLCRLCSLTSIITVFITSPSVNHFSYLQLRSWNHLNNPHNFVSVALMQRIIDNSVLTKGPINSKRAVNSVIKYNCSVSAHAAQGKVANRA